MNDHLEEIVTTKHEPHPDCYSDYPTTSDPRLDTPISTSSAIFGTIFIVCVVYTCLKLIAWAAS